MKRSIAQHSRNDAGGNRRSKLQGLDGPAGQVDRSRTEKAPDLLFPLFPLFPVFNPTRSPFHKVSVNLCQFVNTVTASRNHAASDEYVN